jgi:hypothetical protein
MGRKSRLGSAVPAVGSPDICQKSWHRSEVPTRVSSPGHRKSRLGSGVPTAEPLFRGITPSSGFRIRRSIYAFWPSYERNAMVKSVPYFDNFIKWTFLSVNICPPCFQVNDAWTWKYLIKPSTIKLNSDNTHLIGCSATKGNIYIDHFCSKSDTCIGHCLEST